MILLVVVSAGVYEVHQTASVSSDIRADLAPGGQHQGRYRSADRPSPDKKTAARLLELERLQKRWLEIQDKASSYIEDDEISSARQGIRRILVMQPKNSPNKISLAF